MKIATEPWIVQSWERAGEGAKQTSAARSGSHAEARMTRRARENVSSQMPCRNFSTNDDDC